MQDDAFKSCHFIITFILIPVCDYMNKQEACTQKTAGLCQCSGVVTKHPGFTSGPLLAIWVVMEFLTVNRDSSFQHSLFTDFTDTPQNIEKY